MENDEEASKINDEKLEGEESVEGSGSEQGRDRDEPGDDDDHEEDSSRKSENLYQADQLQLRSLLPEELWRKILNQLDSPEDLQRCVNASPYFWELQRDQRVTFLFPGVFDVLVGIYEPLICYKANELEVEKPKEVDQGSEVNVAESDEEDSELVKQIKAFVKAFREEHPENDGLEADDDDIQDDSDEDDNDGLRETIDPEKRLRLPDGTKAKDDQWISAVCNCRLVCTKWNKAIENCYSRAEMHDIDDYCEDPNPLSPVNLIDRENSWTMGTWIMGSESAEGFIQHFEASHHSGIQAPPKNPVIGRCLSLDIEDSDFGPNRNKKRRTATQLLKMFGKDLWYGRIVVNSWRLTHDLLYLTVRERLCLMPNLKYLELGRIKCKGNISSDLITSHPMPKLENLEMIDIDSGCRGPILNEVLRNNCHIANLKFRDKIREFDEEIGRSLSNLTVFSARTWSRDSYSDIMLKKFGAGWKLSKANLYDNHGDFKGMFQLVQNNWAETLTDLKLEFDYDYKTNILEQSKTLRLNLPFLRRLCLSVGGFMLLDFILPLANSLEFLEIYTWDPKNELDGFRKARKAVVHEQVIEYAGFEKKMHLSNIWQIFKKLKTIKVELSGDNGIFVVYTKEGDRLVYLPKNTSCNRYDMIYR